MKFYTSYSTILVFIDVDHVKEGGEYSYDKFYMVEYFKRRGYLIVEFDGFVVDNFNVFFYCAE